MQGLRENQNRMLFRSRMCQVRAEILEMIARGYSLLANISDGLGQIYLRFSVKRAIAAMPDMTREIAVIHILERLVWVLKSCPRKGRVQTQLKYCQPRISGHCLYQAALCISLSKCYSDTRCLSNAIKNIYHLMMYLFPLHLFSNQIKFRLLDVYGYLGKESGKQRFTRGSTD